MQQQFEFQFPSSNSPTPTRPTRNSSNRHSRTNSQMAMVLSNSNSPTTTSAPPAKSASRPTSHHRRNSSVSTRRESAELMGISAIDTAPTEEGSTTQIRQRALWALEGKGKPSSLPSASTPNNFLHAFNKVEIPEWKTPDAEKTKFDWNDSGSASIKALPFSSTRDSSKRDSFLLQSSSSSKLELHTLLEEDEEDEDERSESRTPCRPTSSIPDETDEEDYEHLQATIHMNPLASTPRIPVAGSPSSSPSTRPRPPSLTLRSLALVSTLPTASQSPATSSSFPRVSGLKSLALANQTGATPVNHAASRSQPLALGLMTPSPSPFPVSHPRKSSISYIRPTSSSSEPRRSMSPSTPDSISSRASSEIFFHTQASALLSRIASLEAALASRTGSLSMPLTPDTALSTPNPVLDIPQCHSPSNSGSPLDEMISLVTDLKSERDELSTDIKGWRTRCADLERAFEIMKRRLAEERRDLWAAKDNVSVLEGELQIRDGKIERLNVDIDTRDASIKALEASLKTAEDTTKALNFEIKSHLATIRSMDSELNSERALLAAETLSAEGIRLATLKEKRGWETERRGWAEERTRFDEEIRKHEKQIKQLEERLAQSQPQLSSRNAGRNVYNSPESDAFPTPKAPQVSKTTPLNFKFPLFPTTPRADSQTASVRRFENSLDSTQSSHTDVEEHNSYPYSYSLSSTVVSHSSSGSSTTSGKASGFGAGFKFGGGSSAPPISTSGSVSGSPTAERLSTALHVVAEEEELESEEDELKGYEDEDEDDSFENSQYANDEESSEDEGQIMPPVLAPAPVIASPVVSTPSPVKTHGHRRSASMVHGWKFPSPTSMVSIAAQPPKAAEVDNFFACLEEPSVVKSPNSKKERKRLPSGCPAFWLDLDEEAEEDIDAVVPDFVSQSQSGLESVLEEETTASEQDSFEGEYSEEHSEEQSEELSFPSSPGGDVTVFKKGDGRPVLHLDFDDASTEDLTIALSSPLMSYNQLEHSTPPSASSRARLPQSASPTSTSFGGEVELQSPLPVLSKSYTTFRPARDEMTTVPLHESRSEYTRSDAMMTSVPPPSTSSMTVPHPLQATSITANAIVTNSLSRVAPSIASRLSLQTLSSFMSWSPRAATAPLCVASELEDEDYVEERRQLMEKRAMREFQAKRISRPTPAAAFPTFSSTSPVKLVDPNVMRERLRMQLEREGRWSSQTTTSRVVRPGSPAFFEVMNGARSGSPVSSQMNCKRCSMELVEL